MSHLRIFGRGSRWRYPAVWLRLDPSFVQAPQVVLLTDREFRVHIEALAYSAEYGTAGTIPDVALDRVRGTPAVVKRLVAVGLWERVDDELAIRDYAPRYFRVERRRAADRDRWA